MNLSGTATKLFASSFLLFSFSVFTKAQSIYELQAGTKIRVQMDNEINSEVSSVDDTFTTVVAEPVKVRDVVVLPAGVVIEGRVTRVNRAAVGGEKGELEVVFETMRFPGGERRAIEGFLVKELKAKPSSKNGILSVVGGTALGAIVGAVTGGDSGALIGAGLGAGIGTTVALLQKGENVRIKADEKFEIKLVKNVTLPVTDF
jgi:hypothetical protein